jgi:multimeric flavodoxin WrbA
LLALMVFGCAGADAQPEQAVAGVGTAAGEEQSDTSTKKPLVVYYSRTGNSLMLATALGTHLDAEVEAIPSEKDRGVFTIMGEQYFLGDDRQEPFEKNLENYNPIIVVAPIYLMKLSAPGRYFIEEVIPEGSEVYVFTTSGGPLASFTQEGITELVTDSGLVAKGVYGFQAGKTQEEFDNETKNFLQETSLLQSLPKGVEIKSDNSTKPTGTLTEKPDTYEQEEEK